MSNYKLYILKEKGLLLFQVIKAIFFRGNTNQGGNQGGNTGGGGGGNDDSPIDDD
jgi:hypothetical protein